MVVQNTNKYELGLNLYGLNKQLLEGSDYIYGELSKIGFKYIEPTIFCKSEVEEYVKKGLVLGGAIWEQEKISEYITQLKSHNLLVSSIFVQYLGNTDINELIEAAVNIARETGIKRFVSAPKMDSKEECERIAKSVGYIADELKKHDIEYFYHNHDRELKIIDVNGENKYILDYFLELTSENVSMELDIGWIELADASITECLEKYAFRIGLIHLNDLLINRIPGDRHTCWAAVGCGSVELEKVAEIVQKLELREHILLIDQEYSERSMLEELSIGYSNIRQAFIL